MGVPKLPGVPALPSYSPLSNVVLAATNILSFVLGAPVWGIFDINKAVEIIKPSSFLGLEVRSNSKISDFPVEKGAFASYNKVTDPLEITVRMCKGGSSSDRLAFRKSIETLKGALTLCYVLSPDGAFPRMNIVGYSYRQETDKGAYILIVEIHLRQVREVTVSYTTNPSKASPLTTAQAQNSASVSPVATGQVQPTAPPISTLASIRQTIGL